MIPPADRPPANLALVVIRPQPGAEATRRAAAELGLDARVFPLFAIRPLPWDPPPRTAIDALLIGSANGMRHGGAGLAEYAGMPAYAVGDRTAEAAREAGLAVVATGSGGLQQVLDAVAPHHRRLLRVAGREHVDLVVPEGVSLLAREIYASEPKPMPRELVELLGSPAVVLLHSGEAAAHFTRLCDENAICRDNVALAAIGPRVAELAGNGWAGVEVAPSTSDAALLALAARMCQVRVSPLAAAAPPTRAPMTQDNPERYPATSLGYAEAPPRRRSRTGVILLTLTAFLLGAALFGWLEWRGYLNGLLPPPPTERGAAAPATAPRAVAPSQASAAALAGIGGVEARVAMLEDRLSRLDFQTSTASGNAARAEGLLVAFAARRLVDRGEPLSFVADQLRVRFANAQPAAVETIVAFSAQPVTIDQLSARLDALSPNLMTEAGVGNLWDRIRGEVSNLFTLRRDSAAMIGPQARIERARLMLTAGRIDEAIGEVERLPGADSAERWITDARRYGDAQRALDLVETTAMLDPRRLNDSVGRAVEQQSPLAAPSPEVRNPTESSVSASPSPSPPATPNVTAAAGN